MIVCVSIIAMAHACPPVQVPQRQSERGPMRLSEGQRAVTSNHKTGTVLMLCLLRMLHREDFPEQVRMMGLHASGGYSAEARQLNFVRDPFVLVDSGFAYHLRRSEKWCSAPLGKTWPDPESAHATFLTWNAWTCVAADERLSANESYADALERLPLERALLLEAVRALDMDLPYVVSSTTDCYEKDHVPNSTGTCRSVLLDDIMRDYEFAYEALVAPTLALPASLGETFRENCGLGKKKPSGTPKEGCKTTRSKHSTGDCGGRAERIELLRQLDRDFLGGIIAQYNDTIMARVTRLRPS